MLEFGLKGNSLSTRIICLPLTRDVIRYEMSGCDVSTRRTKRYTRHDLTQKYVINIYNTM